MQIVMLEPIGISDKTIESYKKKLEDLGHEFVYYKNRTEDESEIIKRAKNADILIITNLPLTANVINSCQNLEFVRPSYCDQISTGLFACSGSITPDLLVAILQPLQRVRP